VFWFKKIFISLIDENGPGFNRIKSNATQYIKGHYREVITGGGLK